LEIVPISSPWPTAHHAKSAGMAVSGAWATTKLGDMSLLAVPPITFAPVRSGAVAFPR